MILNQNINDDWGWYIDIENNCINFTIIESCNNINKNHTKKFNYHFNRLETIEEEDEYYYHKNNYQDKLEDFAENNEINPIEKGFLIKASFTTIVTTIFTYFTSLMFKLIR
jgi:hypothetical protein